MCGQQAGAQCWIPKSDTMTPENVKNASSGPLLENCEPGGSAYVMHVYSWDEATRQRILALEGTS